jgi:hypothetical protein
MGEVTKQYQQNMKSRILSQWTFMRVLHLVMGVLIIIQAIVAKQWFGIALGSYFLSAAIFSLGCAGGSCNITTKQTHKLD